MDISSAMTSANGGIGAGIWACVQYGQQVLPASVTSHPHFKRALPIIPIILGALAGLAGLVGVHPDTLGNGAAMGAMIGLLTGYSHHMVSSIAHPE